MRVDKGKTVLAKGKVRIRGCAEVVGTWLDEFTSANFVPIYCHEDCEIDVEGEYRVVDGCTIPESWKKLAKMDWDTLFIFGSTDCGKSTLATYLANKCGGCYVLDLDIGQADIAHPGAMGYGFVRDCVSLSQAKMINGFFTGCISPMGREAKCLRGVAKLWRELEGLQGRKIVDTTGWVRGAKAKEYKLAKLEIIQPDLVATFTSDPVLEDWKVFEVERGFVVERSREERAKNRIKMYSRELEGATLVGVPSNVKLKTNLFSGKTLPKDFIEDILDCRVISVRKGPDFLVVLTEESVNVGSEVIRGLKELYEVEDIYLISKDDLDGLVLGLYSGKRYLGMGLLRDAEKLVVETRHRNFDRIEFGEFRLAQGKEYIVRVP